jgi:hypothetical protein
MTSDRDSCSRSALNSERSCSPISTASAPVTTAGVPGARRRVRVGLLGHCGIGDPQQVAQNPGFGIAV